MPSPPKKPPTCPTTSLPGPEFLALCREVLDRAGELRFEAQGFSMRPTLKPGDVLCVVPLGASPPRVGEIVLAQSHAGKPVAHRIVAARRTDADRAYITCGDAAYWGLDGILREGDILGRVVAFERDGARVDLPLRPPRLVPACRARWRLLLHSKGADESPAARSSARAFGAVRGLGAGLAALVPRLRRAPLLGVAARALWPDLGRRCCVEIYPGDTAGAGRIYRLDAAVAGRRVCDAILLRPPRPSARWVLTSVRLGALHRGRGVLACLAAEALNVARVQGATEVLALLEPTDSESLAELEGVGFTRLPDSASLTVLCPDVAATAPVPDNAVALRAIPRAAPTSPPTR